ncbi:hypothetical protein [Nocardioides endophyticus]
MKLRARVWTRAGLAGLLSAAVLAVVPVAPASAIQTIAWTTAPPASATLGQPVSFAWSGTANTFLGARITGCFANFPDGNNYTNAFQGNFTTGNCQYTNRIVTTTSTTYPITVGFYLSTGGQMTMNWNVAVQAVSPTLVNLPTDNTLNLRADSVNGATVPPWNVYGQDGVYGTYSATCSPAAGTLISAPGTTGSCSSTNPAGRTTTQAITINVAKSTSTATWNPSVRYNAGTTWGQITTAAVDEAGLQGTWAYQDVNGNAINANAAAPVGTTQVTATWTPSGTTATNWSSVSVTRSITVIETSQVVAFRPDMPTTKTYGDYPFSAVATGTTGGGKVTISAQAGSACTVGSPTGTTTASAVVTITGAGPCVLLADQAASGSYTAAPTVQWSVTVAKRNSTISWTPATTLTYGETLAGVLNASASSSIGGVPGTFAYTVGGQALQAADTLPAGANQTVTATFTPTDEDRYTTATATRTVSVAKAPQTLAVAPIADRTYGAAPFDLDVTGSGPGAVSASATGACTVAGTTVTVVTAGDCTVTVSKAGTANHLAATPVSRTFTVSEAVADLTWETPAEIAYGTPLGDAQLDAVVDGAGDPEGTVEYTLADGTFAVGEVLPAGQHELTVIWTPVDPGWKSAAASVTIVVGKAVPDLTWATPADILQGTVLGSGQLNAVSNQPGTLTYTVDGGTDPAGGQVLPVGDHNLIVTFVPDDTDNFLTAILGVPITVTPQPDTADTLGPEVQHQVDEQRIETQADLSAGETRTFSVTCPSGYFASDGSGRVDAVDQGTGTLADVLVRESRSTSLDTWTVTMVNHATGRAQGKIFADCVQRETAEVDGHRHALVLDQAATETRDLTGPTTVTVACAGGQYPVAPGFQLDGDAVVRRSAADGTSAWTFEVVPSGATTGTFSARCLMSRVSRVAGHDHRLDLRQAAAHVTLGAGEVLEAQTACGDLARGILGGWSLDDGLVLTGAEPRAKTRATRLFNPTSGPLSADLTLQCLETRTVGGSSSTAPAAPSVTPQVVVPAPEISLRPQGSVAAPSSRVVSVTARGRVAADVSCASGVTTCTGKVMLVALRTQRVAGKVLRKGTVLATTTYSIAAGSVDRVVLRTTRRGQRVLPAAGLHRAQLRVGDHVQTVSLRR